LASAGIAAADLAAVFPVGGTSRMPLLADVLQQALGQPPTAVGQPQLVVAKGGARLPLPAVPADPGTARTTGGADITRTTGGAHRSRARHGRDAGGRRVPAWRNLRPRHKLVAVATVALAGVAAVIFWTLPARSTAGQATPACAYKIGYLGASTNFLGSPAGSRAGVALAVEEYNARNPGCTAELVEFLENSPSDATAGAQKAASDPKILGLVGSLYLPDNDAAQPILDQAGVPTISPTFTTPDHPPTAFSTGPWGPTSMTSRPASAS
jgi:hypothetical protein